MKYSGLRAVSIMQPDATLAANEKLRVFGVGHRPMADKNVYRGPVAIHASSSFVHSWRNLSVDAADALEEIGYEKGQSDWPQGAVIGVVDLSKVLPIEAMHSRTDLLPMDHEAISHDLKRRY